MSLSRRLAPWLLLAGVAVASCAPPPHPGTVQAPPVKAPEPSTAPVDTTAPPPPAGQPQSLPPPPEGVPGKEPLLTIGLSWNLDSLTLVPSGPAEVDGPIETKLALGERLSVRRTRHGALCFARGGEKAWQAAMWRGDTLWLSSTEGAADAPTRLFRWNGKTWRGQMKVFLNARGSLTLATRLPLEAYLLGVLPGELGPLTDDQREAGRAQSIAARSFTLFYTGRRGVEGFDLFSTVEDQVYGSVESERPLPSECVRSTAGQVATYDGQPIRANYSSTCGGITADVWEAWPDPPRPYLLSCRDAGKGADYCSASPHYRWHEEWSVAEFVGNLKKFGPTYGVPLPAGGVGQLRDVMVRSRSRSGRVWQLEVTTSTGHVMVPAYSLRQVLRRPGNPNSILRSNLFKIGVKRDARGRPLAVVANGAGSGHGVGLCQTGALGMARAGIKGEDILRHYFSSVEIKRQY